MCRGSTSPDALCRKVRQVGAHIGIALDGDADRVIIVDERGTIVDGDQLLAVMAEAWTADKRLAGNGVVATVMRNIGNAVGAALSHKLLGRETAKPPPTRANCDSSFPSRSCKRC